MSDKRCLKLAKKIKECKDKGMHPKIIRRLEKKLDGAICHHVFPELSEKSQSVFQSVRHTLLTIINSATDFRGDKAKELDAKSQLGVFLNMGVSPKNTTIKTGDFKQSDVFKALRELALNLTKINSNLHANILLVSGMLNSFYKQGYEILGINKDELNLDPYFNKCGLLAYKLMEITIGDMGNK